jgi:hypothetical protein
MEDKNLQSLNRLLGAMNTDAMSADEIIKAFEQIIAYVKKTDGQINSKLVELGKLYQQAIDEIKNGGKADFSKLREQLMTYCTTEMARMMAEHDKKMMEVDTKMDSVQDGEDADEERVIELATKAVLEQIPPPKELEPETPASVRDKLEILEGEDRLDVSAIKGIEPLKNAKGRPIGFGGRGINLYVGGVKEGLAQYINLVAGSNVTITDSLVNGLHTITVAATGGSGFTKLTATETPNGVLKVFTFSGASAKPSFLIVDNVWMQATTALGTVNWTWAAGPKQATLTIPPNDDILGIV